MTRSDREFQYRVNSLMARGFSEEAARESARKECRAIADARRAVYREQAIQKRRAQPKLTPSYGLKSRVGKIEPTSPHRKPSKGLTELRRDLANVAR